MKKETREILLFLIQQITCIDFSHEYFPLGFLLQQVFRFEQHESLMETHSTSTESLSFRIGVLKYPIFMKIIAYYFLQSTSKGFYPGELTLEGIDNSERIARTNFLYNVSMIFFNSVIDLRHIIW